MIQDKLAKVRMKMGDCKQWNCKDCGHEIRIPIGYSDEVIHVFHPALTCLNNQLEAVKAERDELKDERDQWRQKSIDWKDKYRSVHASLQVEKALNWEIKERATDSESGGQGGGA